MKHVTRFAVMLPQSAPLPYISRRLFLLETMSRNCERVIVQRERTIKINDLRAVRGRCTRVSRSPDRDGTPHPPCNTASTQWYRHTVPQRALRARRRAGGRRNSCALWPRGAHGRRHTWRAPTCNCARLPRVPLRPDASLARAWPRCYSTLTLFLGGITSGGGEPKAAAEAG